MSIKHNISERENPLSLQALRNYQTAETERYYYHPDHLGSASWITDSSGQAIQHLQYLPFGETRVDQRETSWSTRYSFSAKEKDEESGYGYFGARYYDSDLSIWLSVDPLANKYPSLSPYNYCANNPIMLVDPNGMKIGNFIDEEGTFLGSDGQDDGKVYVVTEQKDKDKIKENTASGNKTQVSEVGSAIQLPNSELRSSMLAQVTEADKANPNAEHGGLYGERWSSETSSKYPVTSPAPSGPTVNPCNENVEITGPDYNKALNNIFVFGTYHSHPSGTCDLSGNGFIQNVSDADRNNLMKNAKSHPDMNTHPSIVFGMGDSKVRLYNTKNQTATISFLVFQNAR
jgi:RHS repeat-associated protein